MKNIIIILILTAFISFFANEAKAQCPTGFTGTYTVTLPMGGDCYIVANYCLSNYFTHSGVCDIHFTSISFIGDDCLTILPQLSNGQYEVPWGGLIYKIVNLPDTLDCFSIMSLPDCNDQTSRPTNKVSTGGCYSRLDYFDPNGGGSVTQYIPCDVNGQEYCYQDYSFCREFINGEWVIKVEEGQRTPQFTCIDSNCFSLCNEDK